MAKSEKNSSMVIFRPMKVTDIISIHEMYDSLSRSSQEFYPSRILGKRTLNLYWLLAQIALILSCSAMTRRILRKIYPEACFSMTIGFDENIHNEIAIGLAYIRGPIVGGDCHLGICVLDDYQGQGIGSILMKTIINQARKEEAERIVLGVQKNNIKAISLYKKFAFKFITDIYMVLDLKNDCESHKRSQIPAIGIK